MTVFRGAQGTALEIESSLLRRAAALSWSFIAFPTAVAPGSFELASALSAASAEGCSCLTSVDFWPHAARTDAKTQRRKVDGKAERRKGGKSRCTAVPFDR
jgi:hypothetical protein